MTNTDNPRPTIISVTRETGIAGQYSLRVATQYPGEDVESVTFVGNTFGGPIVMILPSGAQTFVSREVTDRIGSELTREWIGRFFGTCSAHGSNHSDDIVEVFRGQAQPTIMCGYHASQL